MKWRESGATDMRAAGQCMGSPSYQWGSGRGKVNRNILRHHALIGPRSEISGEGTPQDGIKRALPIAIRDTSTYSSQLTNSFTRAATTLGTNVKTTIT